MVEVSKAINFYYSENGQYPASIDELSAAYPNGSPKDPFTKELFDYKMTTDGFMLTCLGKDGAEGGDDPPDSDIIVTQNGLVTDDD
jgi:hypothetical protein